MTAPTIDWDPITSVVNVSSVVGLVQGAFDLIAIAIMVSIVVGVIRWGIGMLRSVF